MMKTRKRKNESQRVTVDVVVFTLEEKKLKVLLIQRKFHPFRGDWALPGGFIRPREELLSAALRELKEETGTKGRYLEQLYTFGNPVRDPRGRVITVSYFALMPIHLMKLKASDDASKADFFSLRYLPKLAFDHRQIIEYALKRLRNKIDYTNIAWSLLPAQFTLREVQEVYEIIGGRPVDKRNFRKKILSLGLLKTLPTMRAGLRQRPAKLYSYKTHVYGELKRFF